MPHCNEVIVLINFYCASETRRAYLNKFLDFFCCEESVAYDLARPELLFLDGSPLDQHHLNRETIKKINFPYKIVHDEDINPIRRIYNNFDLIKRHTNVLWLLEDQVICGRSEVDFWKLIYRDSIALGYLRKNDVIQYPVVSAESMTLCEGETIEYEPIEFDKNDTFFVKGHKLVSRRLSRSHLDYLCHNVLYRREFFIRHISFYSRIFSGHSRAEQDWPDLTYFSRLYKIRILRFILKKVLKIIFFNSKIRHIFISETIRDFDFIHVGYESNETILDSNPDRMVSTDTKIPVLESLDLFKNTDFISRMSLRRKF